MTPDIRHALKKKYKKERRKVDQQIFLDFVQSCVEQGVTEEDAKWSFFWQITERRLKIYCLFPLIILFLIGLVFHPLVWLFVLFFPIIATFIITDLHDGTEKYYKED